jgi:hypothetical protein
MRTFYVILDRITAQGFSGYDLGTSMWDGGLEEDFSTCEYTAVVDFKEFSTAEEARAVVTQLEEEFRAEEPTGELDFEVLMVHVEPVRTMKYTLTPV